jgi:hypothetical protein
VPSVRGCPGRTADDGKQQDERGDHANMSAHRSRALSRVLEMAWLLLATVRKRAIRGGWEATKADLAAIPVPDPTAATAGLGGIQRASERHGVVEDDIRRRSRTLDHDRRASGVGHSKPAVG